MLAAGFLSSRKPEALAIGRLGQVESDGMQEWEACADGLKPRAVRNVPEMALLQQPSDSHRVTLPF